MSKIHNLQWADVHACNFLIKWVTCKFSKKKSLLAALKDDYEEFVLFQKMKLLNFNLDFPVYTDQRHSSLCSRSESYTSISVPKWLHQRLSPNYSNSGAYLSCKIAIKMTLILLSVLISTKLNLTNGKNDSWQFS